MLPRLLVVDDDLPTQLAMYDYFTQQGYRVECAGTRPEAEAFLARGCYAVVITDLCLQGSDDSDGLAVVEHARFRCPSTRIVLLTAYISAEVEREAQARGVEVCLEKPQPLAMVAQTLARLLRTRT